MSKNSEETMKKDETKVLDVLRTHAKKNINELGKECGFSPQKVARIIKNLEKEKIIWGYSAVDDGEENDLKHFVLLVKRSNVPLDSLFKEEVISKQLDGYVPGFVHIENIFFTHGTYHGVVTFYANDLKQAKNLVQELMQKIGQYFSDYLLLETLFPIRKQGIKNPQLKNLVDYL